MDRTKKLLMGLTASALLTGTSGTKASLVEGRAAARISETIVQDPKQAQAEETIKRILKGLEEHEAMSLDEILAKESSLNRDTATAALKNLQRNLDIRRIGDGTNDSPFRYYDGSHGHSR